MALLRTREVFEQPRHLPARRQEGQLVGILGAKIDPVGVLQLVALDLRAIDEGAVPAVQVFDPILALIHGDTGMHPRRAVIAHHQLVIRLPSDAERQHPYRHG